MGWTLDRTVRDRAYAETQIHDSLSQSFHASLPHAAELASMDSRVWNTRRRAPRWHVAYLRGFAHALMSARYNVRSGDGTDLPQFIFAHVDPDGAKWSPLRGAVSPHFKDSAAIYAAERGAEMSHWPGAHFWRHSGRVYFGNGAERVTTDAQRRALGLATESAS